MQGQVGVPGQAENIGFGSETWNVWKNFFVVEFFKNLFLIGRGGVLSKGLWFEQITRLG